MKGWFFFAWFAGACFLLGMFLNRPPKQKSTSARTARARLMSITFRDRITLFDPRVIGRNF
jgi:hypothetical protein